MLLRACTLIALVVAGRTAFADDVDDLVAQGDAYAKHGDLTEAIATFKKADAIRPRAQHACLIGLAYTRRELWPQAELFFAQCHARATTDDPLPTWIGKAEQLLADKLAETGAALVTVTVAPKDANASITVSSFEPDERFAPRAFHLARGKHVLEISAPGYVTQTRAVVVDSSAPQTFAVELVTVEAAAEAAAAAARAKQPIVLRGGERSSVPLWIGLGGLALGLGGAATDWFVVKPDYDKLANAATGAVYDRYTTSYKLARDVTVGLYAAGAAAVVTAIVLRLTVYARVEAPVRVSASVDRSGGFVSVGWSR